MLMSDSRKNWPTFVPNSHPRKLLLAVVEWHHSLHQLLMERGYALGIGYYLREDLAIVGQLTYCLVDLIIDPKAFGVPTFYRSSYMWLGTYLNDDD